MSRRADRVSGSKELRKDGVKDCVEDKARGRLGPSPGAAARRMMTRDRTFPYHKNEVIVMSSSHLLLLILTATAMMMVYDSGIGYVPASPCI